MKKILANALTLVAAFVMTLSASAIALEAVENAPVGEAKETVMFAEEGVLTLGDVRDGLGKAVMVANGADATVTHDGLIINTNGGTPNVSVAEGQITFVESPDGSGKTVISVPSTGYFPINVTSAEFAFIHGKNGKFFLTADYYLPTGSNINGWSGLLASLYQVYVGHVGGSGSEDQGWLNSTKDAWISYVSPAMTVSNINDISYRGNFSASAPGISKFYMSLSTDNGYYAKDFGLYFYPEKSFMIKTADGTLELKEGLTEYTFGTIDGYPNYVWSDGTVNYAQGQKVPVADLEYKTFAPVEKQVLKPAIPTEIEGLGDVVFYSDGSSLTSVDFSHNRVICGTNGTTHQPQNASGTIVSDPADSEGYYVTKMTNSQDTEAEVVYGFAFDQFYARRGQNADETGEKAKGRYYITAEYYIPENTTVTSTTGNLGRVDFSPWDVCFRPESNTTADLLMTEKNKWVRFVSSPIGVDATGNPTVHMTYSTDNTPESDLILNVWFGISVGAKQDYYIRNTAICFFPANSFYLNGTMITATEANYTLPTTCIDETGKIYQAGVTAVSELEYHTLKTASETLDLNQIRFAKTTDEKQVTGMRFAALIDLSTHDAADEYGFIVTGKDILEAGSVTDIQSFTKDSGVKYLIGAAYNKADGTEVIYDRDGSRGLAENGKNYAITAIINGITPKLYDTQFVVRPYIMVNGTTYYGTAKAQSYRAVARAIATGGYVGYDDNKDDIDAIINNTEANA